jgi:hypothetical protein
MFNFPTLPRIEQERVLANHPIDTIRNPSNVQSTLSVHLLRASFKSMRQPTSRPQHEILVADGRHIISIDGKHPAPEVFGQNILNLEHVPALRSAHYKYLHHKLPLKLREQLAYEDVLFEQEGAKYRLVKAIINPSHNLNINTSELLLKDDVIIAIDGKRPDEKFAGKNVTSTSPLRPDRTRYYPGLRLYNAA